MKTDHTIYFEDSRNMSQVATESVDLVVTSPPYPMIEMWDDLFIKFNPNIKEALDSDGILQAFELMHKELDPIWDEVFRILKKGGTACINIGDATRTIKGDFALYTNHARILNYMQRIGFSSLPAVIWRKQTNAPNKFMGSGMLPPGAYVTLEHEYILIFRKGPKMDFINQDEKVNRRESAFFWEERNNWYSDVWLDLKGTTQNLKNDKVRSRSAAYPFELPYRLINMFSVKGGLVLDPFLGTGTTTSAAMASARNSIGYEIDSNFRKKIIREVESVVPLANSQIRARLNNHQMFIQSQLDAGYKFKYLNKHYGFPIMTRQETDLLFNDLISVAEKDENEYQVTYSKDPQSEFRLTWDDCFVSNEHIEPQKQNKLHFVDHLQKS